MGNIRFIPPPPAWSDVTAKLVTTTKTFYAPDYLQDKLPVLYCSDVVFPNGATVKHLSIRLPVNGVYSLPFIETDVAEVESAIATVATGAGERYKEKESAFTDDAIAANSWIFVNIPSTDVDWVSVTVIVEINDS